jgi:hypothetical protein
MPIQPCSCQNAFQDKRYGKGKRVFNQTTKGTKCTVCEAQKGEAKKK